jgi:glycosyltransferase involved in cell wall biosynthesis
VSVWSRDNIIRTLGVDPGHIRVLNVRGLGRPAGLTVDGGRRGYLLYVGSLARHKNVPFLIRAFGRTHYAREGGTLRLVGGDADEITALKRQIPGGRTGQVRIAGRVSDRELEDAYRQADAVVQPSLAEGFGLPAREATLRGLPLCHSGRGAMSDITGDDVWVFDPTDEQDAARAMDAAIAAGQRDQGWTRWRRATRAATTGNASAMADDVADAARLALAGAR